ncbi:hypothetical protein EV184_12378 [Sinorhizobium americanum]|uniref:Uncharacterized protein n=1 Tax=Sinorhizobium americanum TaxID=194963 RepID=A0A4R2B916_9HYPH|nr:hypothetical protein EV184_12378 [Sinorhizobium americanum]
MDRNYLAGEQGDVINAVLAAAGYNFSLLLRWFRQLLTVSEHANLRDEWFQAALVEDSWTKRPAA